MTLQPSSSTRMFAIQWWSNLSVFEKMRLREKYYNHYPLVAVERSTSCIVRIYREENE